MDWIKKIRSLPTGHSEVYYLGKKYGVSKATELKFKTKCGVNLNSKKSFLNTTFKTIFNRLNKKRLVERKL